MAGRIMRFQRQGTCCSIYVRSGCIFASKWRRRYGGLGNSVLAVDEVHGFRYFDDRDLLGIVDGTENHRGQAVIDAALIGEEDAAFAGGSCVIVQKYLHDLVGWNALFQAARFARNLWLLHKG
jgi:Dyp-type peroxidase family